MGSFTIKHNVQVGGLDGLDQLSAKQKVAEASSASLDNQLDLTRQKLKALVSEGAVGPKEATGITNIIGQYQKFGVSVRDSINLITKAQDQYADSTVKLARRIGQSLDYQIASQARANQEAAALRQADLAAQQRHIAQSQKFAQATQGSFLFPSPISNGSVSFSKFNDIQASQAALRAVEAKFTQTETDFSSRISALGVASSERLRRTLEDTTRRSNSTLLPSEIAIRQRQAAEAAEATRAQLATVRGPALSAIEDLTTSGQIPSAIAAILRSGVNGNATEKGKGSAGIADFLSSLSTNTNRDPFSRDLAAAANLLQTRLSNAAKGVEEVAEEAPKLAIKFKDLFNFLSAGTFLTTGSYRGSRAFQAVNRAAQATGLYGPDGKIISSGGGGGGGGGGVVGGLAGAAGAGEGAVGAEGATGLFGLSLGATVAAGVGIGIGAATAILVHYADAAAEAAREEQNLAERTGLTITQFGNLKGVASILGVNINALAIGFKGLAEATQNPQSQQGRALASLGVSPVDNVGRARETIDIIQDISKAVRGLSDTEARDIIDKIIPGRSAELLPLFRSNLQELTKTVQDAGFAFTAQGAVAAEEYARRLATLELRWESLKRSFGTKAIGVIEFLFPESRPTPVQSQSALRRALGQPGEAPPANLSTSNTFNPLSPSNLSAFLRDQDFAAGQYRQQKAFQDGQDGTREGLERQIAKAKKDLETAQLAQQAPGKAGGPTQDTLIGNVTAAEAKVESLQDKLKALTSGPEEIKRLSQELDKLNEQQLFGIERIAAENKDRIALIPKELQGNQQILDGINKISDAESKRFQIREDIANRRTEDASLDVRARIDVSESTSRARNQLTIDRSRFDSSSPAARRDDLLSDADLETKAASANLDTEIARIARAIALVNTLQSKGEIGSGDAGRERRALLNEGYKAQSSFDEAIDKGRVTREVALNQYRLAAEKEIGDTRKDNAEIDLNTYKAIASIREQFSAAQSNRAIGLLGASGDPFAAAGITSLRASAAESQRNSALSAIGNEIGVTSEAQSQARTYQEFLGYQKRLNDLRVEGAKAEATYDTQIYELRTQQEIDLAKYREAQVKSVESAIGTVFDAGVSKGTRGIGEVLAQQGRGILRTVVTNTGGELFKQTQKFFNLDSLIPGQYQTDANGQIKIDPKTGKPATTPIGSILANTPFAAKPPQIDIPIRSIDKNAGLMQKDIKSILDLLTQAQNGTAPFSKSTGVYGTGDISSLPSPLSGRLSSTLPSLSKSFGFSSPSSGFDPFSIATPGFNGRPVSESISLGSPDGSMDFSGVGGNGGQGGQAGQSGQGDIPGLNGINVPYSPAPYGSTSLSTYDSNSSLPANQSSGPIGSASFPSSPGTAATASADLKSASTQLSSIAKFFGGTQYTGDLSAVFTGTATQTAAQKAAGIPGTQLSGLQQAGAIIGTAGVVASGVSGAISGFKRGGVSGTAQGVGSVLGTAAILDPEPISKSVLAIGAAVASAVSAIFGDPRQKRAADQQKELLSNQYIAPVAQNRTSDLQGNFVSSNYKGQIVSTQFSDIPIIQSGFLDRQKNIIPGTTYSTFGQQPGFNPSGTPNPNQAPVQITNNIQTFGPSDFHAYLQANPQALNAGIHTALSQPGEAQSTIRQVATGQA